ncbi:FCD domain-containing protein [Pseudophaeobacter sp.]|jgi:DNA-binding FadR family transcriptional regulator|uniref:FadR/GntR family transcriptional regulator n=1 Tax=Pseudophaeobacter sp. TaxID=1971739 RepID=UPI0032D93C67
MTDHPPRSPAGTSDTRQPQQHLAQQLRQGIASGTMLRGDRLLPEREMAQHLGVSRARLRQALDLLEAEGALFRRRGQGTFVQPPPATDAARLKSLAQRVSPQEVMEVRLQIEPALAGLAALRADDQARERFAQAAQATLDALDQHSYDAADDVFHYKIAEMAQNPLFLTVYEAIRTVRAQSSWATTRAAHYSPEVMAVLGQQHQTLAAAILKGDSPAATQIMQDHLHCVAETLLQSQ